MLLYKIMRLWHKGLCNSCLLFCTVEQISWRAVKLQIFMRFNKNHDVLNFYSYLPPANEVCEGYVFTGVCLSTPGGGCGGLCMVLFGGHAWFYLGGMHGFIWGECMVLFGGMHGFIWGGMCGFIQGACMVLFGGCAWFYLAGMHGFIRGCVVLFGGMCGFIWGVHGFIWGGMLGFSGGGRAWFFQFFRAVRILLECILVTYSFPGTKGLIH